MTVFKVVIFLAITACHAETEKCTYEGCASSEDDDRSSMLQTKTAVAPNLIEVAAHDEVAGRRRKRGGGPLGRGQGGARRRSETASTRDSPKPKLASKSEVNELDEMSPSTLAKVMDIAFPQVFSIMTAILSTDYCWRTTKTRKKISPTCAANQVKAGARCRDKCRAGYQQVFRECHETCPSFSKQALNKCKYKKSKKDRCQPGFHERRRKQCRKNIQSYGNGKERNTGCPNPRYPVLMKSLIGINKCYEAPPAGYNCDTGAKQLCWANCPVGMVKCPLGMACASSKGGCGAKIAEMTIGAATALSSTVALIGSFGAAGVGGTQALNAGKTKALDTATKAALSKAVKSQLVDMQKKLMKEAIKKKILKKVKEEIKGMIKDMATNTVDKLASDAVDAAIGEFEKKSVADYTENFFDKIDPTGIKKVVDAYRDGHKSSGLDKAKAWMDVASLIDPTGWIASAATFMNAKCAEV